MAGSRLDNHVLHLRLSSRPALRDNEQTMAPVAWETAAANGKPAKGSKLLVRNVPFEANKRELRDLFSGFGQLKTLRLPKKIDGTHRGFAFVEFVSKQQAGKALQVPNALLHVQKGDGGGRHFAARKDALREVWKAVLSERGVRCCFVIRLLLPSLAAGTLKHSFVRPQNCSQLREV